MPSKTYFNWSSGKDSALALYHLLQDPNFSVECLLTTISEGHQRVSMHGLRKELLIKQLTAIGIPYSIIPIPERCANGTYERIMRQATAKLITEGFEYAAFGDIFLEDLKSYREEQLKQVGLKGYFPLWKRSTTDLLEEFWDLGFKTIIVAASADKLDRSFVGRALDRDCVKDLPGDVDPCGENGEFHTFCYQAPYFRQPIDLQIGETVYREYPHGPATYGHWFCDLI